MDKLNLKTIEERERERDPLRGCIFIAGAAALCIAFRWITRMICFSVFSSNYQTKLWQIPYNDINVSHGSVLLCLQHQIKRPFHLRRMWWDYVMYMCDIIITSLLLFIPVLSNLNTAAWHFALWMENVKVRQWTIPSISPWFYYLYHFYRKKEVF